MTAMTRTTAVPNIRSIAYAFVGGALLLAGAAAQAGEVRQAYPSPDLHGLPYSAAVRAGNTVYVSGVLGLVPGGGELTPGGITAETETVFERIGQMLEIAGTSFDKVVKCTVLLADIDDFPAMNAVFRSVFPQDPPARSTIIVPALPLGAAIEIECNALIEVE